MNLNGRDAWDALQAVAHIVIDPVETRNGHGALVVWPVVRADAVFAYAFVVAQLRLSTMSTMLTMTNKLQQHPGKCTN